MKWNRGCLRAATKVPALALAGVAVVVGSAIPANADTPQPDGPPDGGDHSWCYLSGFNQQTAADAAMTRLRDQTQVTTMYPGACGTHTDVRWRQAVVTGAYGEATCVLRNSADRCDVYRLTLNMTEINAAAQPVNQRSKTSCHELGHTVGVRHYSGTDYPGDDTAHSCMRSGEVTSSWTNITLYGTHHKSSHINVTF